ncbi:MAG: hypothetical protein IJ111_12160 [Eggerthellaceae bacterium]|nr:hypothetical protein [Eggerthellaceae bacterium]
MDSMLMKTVRRTVRSSHIGLVRSLYNRNKRDVRSGFNHNRFLVEAAFKARNIGGPNNAVSTCKLFDNVDINPDQDRKYFYNIDIFKSYKRPLQVMLNCTLDWDFIVNHPLEELRIVPGDHETPEGLAFIERNNQVLDSVLDYLHRSVAFVLDSRFSNRADIITWLGSLETCGARSFNEALQRILFVNELLWQTPHNLMGLGRLDLILGDLYEADLASGKITKESALESLKEFLTCLHGYYWYKSGTLTGDTGQIVILGGKMPDGSYFCNDLTYLFINAIRELQLPDPKALLRVADDVPRELMACALDCIKTGVGNPLFSNDELVIPALIDFGYEEADAYNYVTSACWEPLVPGVAHEQNNLFDVHFLKPLSIMSEKGELSSIDTFEQYVEAYLNRLDEVCDDVCAELDDIEWEPDPLLSLFTEPCRTSRRDLSEGGGKYNNYGVLSLGMGNIVNSLFIVKKLVFDEHRFTLEELDGFRKANYEGHEDILELLKNEDKLFGRDAGEVLDLTRRIMQRVQDDFRDYRNVFGGRIKCGLSSPSYISGSKFTEASFDGRLHGAPYMTHISADGSNSYTELMVFASKLDYTGIKFNGNVVDFFTTPSFIEQNYDNFLQLLMTSLKMGVFQMQLNVVSAATLIDAREHPEKYPDLIVRVWGFSAYFIDLPDIYKDTLIERALQSEAAN